MNSPFSPTNDQKPAPWTRSGIAGIAIIAFWILVALAGPWVAPHGLEDFVSDGSFSTPAAEALLGTDYLGRDILSRIVHGTSLTLLMAGSAAAIATSAGSALGLYAGTHPGWIDNTISRLLDVIHSFPTLMLSMVVIVALGASPALIVALTGIVYATSVYRIARALAMDMHVMDFVIVARARGEGSFHILFREVLPNVAPPLLVDFGMRLCFSILFISSLSFLGMGVQPPMADWGSLVRENMGGLVSGSLASVYPALAIASITIGLNLLVDDVARRDHSHQRKVDHD